MSSAVVRAPEALADLTARLKGCVTARFKGCARSIRAGCPTSGGVIPDEPVPVVPTPPPLP